MLKAIIKFFLKRKLLAVILFVVPVIVGYFGYQALGRNKNTVSYSTAVVEKGIISVAVSGTGQIAAVEQIDVKTKVPGDIIFVGISNGQEVKAGDLLAKIDDQDAQKAVRNAETDLETAKLELEKLIQPPDAYSLLQAENALTQAKETMAKLKLTQASNHQNNLDSIKRAEDNLEKAYESAFNNVAAAFLDLPAIITNLDKILYGNDIAKSEPTVNQSFDNKTALGNSVSSEDAPEMWKFIDDTEVDYKTARDKYNINLKDYKNTSRYSNKAVIEALLEETLETTKAIAEALKSEVNMLDLWVDLRSDHNWSVYNKVKEFQSDLRSDSAKANGHISSLLSVQSTIEDNKNAKANAERALEEADQNDPLDLAAAQRSVREKEESLKKLKAAPDTLEVRAKEINIRQKQEALANAKQQLADYQIKAPINGIVSNTNIKTGEEVSANAVLASIITKQKVAKINLNEVDVAKIKVGQQANLAFDAISELNITGRVAEVESLGTVSQGVVSYGATIALDIQDDRLASGMSVSVSIITEMKPNVLLVPNSAIKQRDEETYVLLAEGKASGNLTASDLRIQPVQTGLSNDTLTEVIEGLKEGDRVVTKATTTTGTSKTNQQQRMNFGIPGLTGGRPL